MSLSVGVGSWLRNWGGRISTTRVAPALDFPTAANPPVVTAHVPIDAISGDVLALQWSQDPAFASGVSSGNHTLADTDVSGGTVTGFGIPTLSTGAPWYFRSQVTSGGAWSNSVAWNDAVAPTITTSTTTSQTELFPLAIALTANKTISKWAITGGADQTQFTIAGSTLEWFNNGVQDYTVPNSSVGTNVYVVQVTATDLAGNNTNLTETVTVTAANKTATFTPAFTNVIPSTPNTLYTSNTTTIGGLTNGLTVSGSLDTGFYSKNGGPFTAAGSLTAQNGDTFALRTTSGPGASDVSNLTLTVGLGSSKWTVSNTANTAAWTTTAGASLNQNTTISGSPALTYATSSNLTTQLVRANQSAASKRYFEITLGSGLTGDFVCGIDDGTTSFGPSTTAAIPGHSTSTGLSFANGPFGWQIETASTVLFSDYASGTKTPTAGDIIGFEFDTTAHTCQVWRKKSGTWGSLGTVSTGFSLSAYYAFGGVQTDGGSVCNATANFGASAFDRTPTSGYIGYGN